ncbi:uncharacterized protein [Montipora foliosa]|uniref:uncharacterized protein n=1 Tax=Montipora foliosa TaxID=591990 RepID=UPI0035F13ECF
MDQDMDKDKMLSAEVQELLVDIVQNATGGGNISLNIVEELFQERTRWSLSDISSHEQCTSGNQEKTLEYLQSILSDESPLKISADGYLYLQYCEELTLDCSAESEKSLSQVIKDVKLSAKTTQIDLSRRCFTSKKELLEVCKPAKMLKRLILQDISFVNDIDESDQGIALIKLIRWYCPNLREVDTTGCSDVTLSALFTSENDILKETGISASMKADVNVVDLLKTIPDLKECLMPASNTSNLSNLSSRIRDFVLRGVPANITYDGWSFLHTASAIGDAKLVSWLLENATNNKFQFVGSRRPTALDIAIYRHDATIVKLLLNEHKTYDYDPCNFVNLCILSQISPEVCTALEGDVGKSCVCNPLEVGILITDRMNLEYKKSFVLEICKALERMPSGEFGQKKCWVEELLVYLLKKLVESGCSPDISIKELNGKTPLMCVAKSPVLVKTLLDLGANGNIKDQEGNTALFYVAKVASLQGTNEHLETLQLLIKSGVDVNVRNHCGDTALLYCTISTERSTGQTGLHEELPREYCVKTWRLLIQAGADVAARNHRRQSIVHLIVEKIKSWLHKLQGCSTETRIEDIGEILIEESVKQIRFIYDCNKDVIKSRDEEGNTPLHVLASHDSVHHAGMVRIAETLVTSGSKVNIANDDDQTPLHLAKSWSMAEYLLKKEAQPNVLDNKGRSPLICRCSRDETEDSPVLEPLNKWSEGMNFGLDPWLEYQSKNTFLLLMESAKFSDLHSFIQGSIGIDSETIFITDSKGNTLLHRLCNYNDPRVMPLVDLLLLKGADVNKQNEDGDSPLHISCRKVSRMPSPKGEKSVFWRHTIPSLLRYGADCHLKNKKDCSVVDIAWYKKSLLRKVRRPLKQKQPEPCIPWNPVSKCHYERLSQVVRRRNVQKVDDFFFHADHIGSGTFGVVYAAINKADGRETALKRVERLRLRTRQIDREIESLVQLSSCFQVVKYLKFILEPDFTWIVLELMEGDLDKLLKEQFDENCLPSLCNDMLTGVKYLHENKLLHRDLKPSNVLYTYIKGKGRPFLKISDFGLSKNLGPGMSLGSSVFHSNAGSRCWMAPELLSTRPFVHSFESDIFASGLILHYLLAKGHHPFEGSNPIQNSPIGAIEQNILNNSTSLSPDITDEAKDLVMLLLSANKDDRPKASEALKHPFFWSNDRKIQFLTAVGNQKEIGTYTPLRATAVEQQLENQLRPFFPGSDWAALFTAIYNEMTSSAKGRSYTTSSAVHLIRFIRNAYAHVSDSSRTSGFQAALLTDYIFLRKIPNLVLIAYKAVKSGKWDLRPEISKVLDFD